MIPLTRIRHDEVLYLNPDLFERVDSHVDTVIRLTNGTEYLVVESAEEIVRRITEYRASVIALAGVLQANAFAAEPATHTPAGQATAGSSPAWSRPGELAGSSAPLHDPDDPMGDDDPTGEVLR